MPLTPFSRMPRPQQVAVIMSLQKKGLWTFKPIEKFKNFSKWMKEFGGISALRKGIKPAAINSVEETLDHWLWAGAELGEGDTLMNLTGASIRNSSRFGKISRKTITPQVSGEIEYLARLRALNQRLLRKKFPSGKITLYRGIHSEQAKLLRRYKGKKILANHNFLASYTESYDMADEYASLGFSPGIILTTTLPIERSAYSWRALKHPGFKLVEEHLIFGGKFPVKVP